MSKPSLAAIELTEAFFQKIAGWEAVKHARALLATGKVLSSNWTPPILKGVVLADDTSYRAGLKIADSIDIENLCTCRQSRQWGTICPHSVAVGLHHLKAPTADPDELAKPGTATRPPSPALSRTPVAITKDPVRLRRNDSGEPIEIHVIIPPNLAETFARGKVLLVFEGATNRSRNPLNAFVRSGTYAMSAGDAALLDAAEMICGGDTPGMVQLSTKDFASLLPAMAGHPRLTLGRKQSLGVSLDPIFLPAKATLEPSGEILIALKPSGLGTAQILAHESAVWAFSGSKLQPVEIPRAFFQSGFASDLVTVWAEARREEGAYSKESVTDEQRSLRPNRPKDDGECTLKTRPRSARGVLQGPVKIPRPQIPEFLAHEWPKLQAGGRIEANFKLEDFILEQAPPKIILNLAGGLAQLTGTLQCAYGPRIMTVGVTAKDEVHWLPDPTNPRRYSTRDLGAEHAAYMRLRQSGFSGPNLQGQWQLLGQDRVVSFFAREFPKIERAWEVHLEERLDRSAKQNLERITPDLRVLPSGEQWFDLEVSYTSAGGERLSAADIQELIRGNGTKRLKNGRLAIIDTGAVEELQEVLLDCNPQQQTGPGGLRYRMSAAQAGFLETSTREQGFQLEAPAPWKARAEQQRGAAALDCPPLGPLDNILRPYQKQGVGWLRFLRGNAFGGVLADEMGLGKTLQVLAHLDTVRKQRGEKPLPCLVVCPTSLVFNWVAEAKRFTPDLKVLPISGAARQARFAEIEAHDIVVTSYALIRRDFDKYRSLEFDTVILDEAQHIKNRKTQNAQAVKALRAEHRVVLTGTPLENSVLDLWSIFDFLMPGYLGSAKDFQERYEIPIAREKDTASMSRLAKRVRPFLLRRMKRDVVKELPDKLEQISFCDLTEEQAAIYQQVLSATRKEVLESDTPQTTARSRMMVLTALLRLRQICCDLRLLGVQEETPNSNETDAPKPSPQAAAGGKLQLFSELLDEVIDGGHRVLVFSQFTSMLRLLRDQLTEQEVSYCYLDGSTANRGEVVQRFQSDASIPVFLISLKAGGVGLNLTGADTVIHFDPWWNPAVEDQATDRAHRIGQTRVVTSYKLIARGTVEEKIVNLQKRKRDLIAATLTGETAFTESLTWEEIQDLLN